jgi:hypothetical protein
LPIKPLASEVPNSCEGEWESATRSHGEVREMRMEKTQLGKTRLFWMMKADTLLKPGNDPALIRKSKGWLRLTPSRRTFRFETFLPIGRTDRS